MLRRAAVTAMLTGSLLFAPSAFAADPSGRADIAASLFWQGRRAAEAQDLPTACDRFARSLALERLPGTLLNLASCEEGLGRVASALRHYEEAESRLRPDDRRRAVVADRAQSLGPRVPRLTLTLAPGSPHGTRVRLEGAPRGQDVFKTDLPLDPGVHRLHVTAPGRALRVIEVTLVAGETRSIAVEPGAALSPSPVAPPPVTKAPVVPVEPPRGSVQRTLGFSLFGLGGAGVVLGAVAGGIVLQEKATYDKQCPSSVCRSPSGIDTANRGMAWGTTADIAFATAAVAIGVGLVLVLTAPSKPVPPPPERVAAAR